MDHLTFGTFGISDHFISTYHPYEWESTANFAAMAVLPTAGGPCNNTVF
jgi:hypothetical protein